jgi:hypothetical protein
MAALLFGTSDPAEAKGPESVTISGPGIERTIELMDTENFEMMARLMEQTGLWFGTGDLPLPIEAPAGELGAAYTLAWVNGGPADKSVEERTIRQVIYPEAENGPVIHTPPQESLQGWGPGVIGWFAASSGLRDTLVKLGAPISAKSPSRAAANSGAAFSEAAIPEKAVEAAQPEREPPGVSWRLAILALVLALAAGLAGMLGAWLIKARIRNS